MYLSPSFLISVYKNIQIHCSPSKILGTPPIAISKQLEKFQVCHFFFTLGQKLQIRIQNTVKHLRWKMESFTIFLSLIWLLQSQILATWRKQPQSRDYSHCVLSDLTRKVTGSLVTRLGPKARPSALVGFESGTFQSVVDALFQFCLVDW